MYFVLIICLYNVFNSQNARSLPKTSKKASKLLYQLQNLNNMEQYVNSDLKDIDRNDIAPLKRYNYDNERNNSVLPEHSLNK